jgi:hypothetical protein
LLLEAAEHMAHVRVWLYLGAVVVLVTATQDGAGGCGLRSLRVGQADVAIQRGELPLRVVGVDGIQQVRGGRGGGIQRRAANLASAEDPLLLPDRDHVPLIQKHPDDPHHLVGATGGPAGSGAPGWTQTCWFIWMVLVVSGLVMPSLKPIQSRGMPTGRGGNRNPSTRYRSRMPPPVLARTSNIACPTVSRRPAHSCTSKSPSEIAGSRLSWANARIVSSWAGLFGPNP